MHSLAYQTRIQYFTLKTFYQWVSSWGSIVNMMIKGWWHRRFGPFRPLYLYTGETGTLLKKVIPLAKLTRELGFFECSLRMSTIKSRWLLLFLFFILLLLTLPFILLLIHMTTNHRALVKKRRRRGWSHNRWRRRRIRLRSILSRRRGDIWNIRCNRNYRIK